MQLNFLLFYVQYTYVQKITFKLQQKQNILTGIREYNYKTHIFSARV